MTEPEKSTAALFAETVAAMFDRLAESTATPTQPDEISAEDLERAIREDTTR